MYSASSARNGKRFGRPPWIGNRGFKSADPALFRRVVLGLLVLLAILTAGQGLFQLFGGPASAEI